MIDRESCPFCLRPVEQERVDGVVQRVPCDRCGEFKIEKTLMGTLDEDQRNRLAGLTREARDLKQKPLLITFENLNDRLAEVPHRIPDRADRLLAAISRRTKFFGELIGLHVENDVPLAYACNSDEFRSFVNYLHDAGLIKRGSWTSGPTIGVILTALGFESLESRNPDRRDSDTAFVAMWFDTKLDPAFIDGIKPAVEEDCKFRAVKMDLEEHNDDIMDRVLAEIRKSRFSVADFSGHRSGVYFEAGYALGLQIPVIWLCRNDEMEKAHFDTEHFHHIVWSDADELRRRLALRIQATIGVGPKNG